MRAGKRNSRWFPNRSSANLENNNRESIIETEISSQLQQLDEFEKHCKTLEKALKRFVDTTQATKKSSTSCIQWFMNYLEFHNREKASWLVEEFLLNPVIFLCDKQEPAQRRETKLASSPARLQPKLNRLSMFALSPPKLDVTNSPAAGHKRSASQNIKPRERGTTAAPEMRRSSGSLDLTINPGMRASSDFEHIISLHEQIPQWTELQEQILKLRTDLCDNMDYLLVEAVINSSKDYVKKVNAVRRNYEKARMEHVSAKTKLEREKTKILESDPTAKNPYVCDITKLFNLEREQVRAELFYDEYVIELMDLLTSEKRNVDLGQSILKYLETQKRYFQRTSALLSTHKSGIASTGQWKINVQEQLKVHQAEREFPIQQRNTEEGKIAWKRLALIILRPNSVTLSVILELLGPLCSTSRKQELLESIVYLFVSQVQPFPPELAEYVHLASQSMGEDEFYYGKYASNIIQFLHAHYNEVAENLRRYNADEFTALTAALSDVVCRSEIAQ
uniref:Uncharacterized protein n=1 Tax=Vannella robusta TaxID=1487602 RepID=A0A7S4MMI7_9EUKA|mmetsp:Transcript_3168/g.3898  ORF Transcript_3168/g.3898 Transcript_3168/m.3898 type:complete len:507 (+) Transcript_3168:61-1581(+)